MPSLTHLVQTHAAESKKTAVNLNLLGTPKPKFAQQAQDRRIRQQVQVAVQETDHYTDLFSQSGLDGQEFSASQMAKLPLTTKEDLRHNPQGFVRRGFQPTLCTMTTGTTGQGTTTLFTNRETQLFSSMSALGLLRQGLISKEDIVRDELISFFLSKTESLFN